MAFNIMAESNKKLDFERLHEKIYSEDLNFEFIPMPDLGIEGGDAIGICVPSGKLSPETWNQLKPVLRILKNEFHCDVYDLYGGQKLGFFNGGSFKKNLFA